MKHGHDSFLSILFATVSKTKDTATRNTVFIEEKQCAAGPQLHLHVMQEPASEKLHRKDCTSFTEVRSLLNIFLYPNLGYGELFQLLSMEKDSFAVYKFQKLMIRILVDRTNNGCVESNREICRYLLDLLHNLAFQLPIIDSGN